jgi:hypothetical protein
VTLHDSPHPLAPTQGMAIQGDQKPGILTGGTWGLPCM